MVNQMEATMAQIVVGKALDSENWIRSEQAEYVTKPMLGDIILFEDTVYRVAGGNGWKPVQLWYCEQDAVNDDMAAVREIDETHDSLVADTREGF
jgi:hypothetical protein